MDDCSWAARTVLRASFRTVVCWKFQSKEGSASVEYDVVDSVCALPDGRIFTGWRHGCARVFSSSGVKLLEMEHGASSVVSVCVLPDGRLVTGSNDGTARVISDSGIEILKRENLWWQFCQKDAVKSRGVLGLRIAWWAHTDKLQ